MSTQTLLHRPPHVAVRSRASCKADQSASRARIQEAAARLYRRIGHKKTTVADIARELSMSPANVYRFFPSKQAIEEAVVEEMLNKVVAAAVDAASRIGPLTARLQAVLQAVEQQHKSSADNDSRLYELVVSAMRDNWGAAAAYADCMSSIVAQVISEGQANGDLQPRDSMVLARCLLSATSAYLYPLVVPGSANFARPTLTQMIEFCAGALRAAPPSRHLAA